MNKAKFKIVQDLILQNKPDEAISFLHILKNKYSLWSLNINKIINGQIGSIYYMQKQYTKSETYLDNSYDKMWISITMLAVIYYIKKDYKKMDNTFLRATNNNSEQEIVWSIWAYCNSQIGEISKSIDIINKGILKIGSDNKMLQVNMLLLKNEKKMKMKPYGEQWYQFHLEEPTHVKNKIQKRRLVTNIK